MPRTPLAALAILVALLAGCGEERRDPAPSMAESPDAATVVRELEQDLHAIGGLPVERQEEAQRAFGARLQRDLVVCKGTRYENKPLYWLVQWTLAYGGEEAPQQALRLLDRLDILPSPAFRNPGRVLRVNALLRLGRLPEARDIAKQVEQDVPEFGALRRVEFYELVGQPALPLPGTVVSGQGAAPDQTFILVVFIGMPDAGAEAWLKPLLAAAGERVRVVVVATAGDLLTATTVASAWGVEVRWLRQGDPALAGWRLPGLPSSVLLGPGPQRLTVAVEVQPAQLGRLSPATKAP